MFNPKKLLLKKISEYKIDFSTFANGMNYEMDDNLMPIKYAKQYYNYTVKDGSLKTGLGFNRLSLPVTYDTYETQERVVGLSPNGAGILALWHHKYFSPQTNTNRHRVVFHTDDENLYFFPTIGYYDYIYTVFPPFNLQTFHGKIHAFNYHLNGDDRLIILVPEEQKIITFASTEEIQVIENAPNLVTFGLHYERLFAVLEGDRKRLMFSATLDPTNWNIEEDEGGFIDMRDERGRINKIISFNDYVYVFRDYGVSRVSAYGDQNDFSVSQLFVSSSKIFGASVVSCGDRIIFLARDGLHAFDGYSTSKIQLNFESMFKNENNDNCFGLFFQNKYYLACRMDFDDNKQIGCEAFETGYFNNVLLEYDLKTGDVNILRGVDIRNMIGIEESNVSKLAACFNGQFKDHIGQLDNSGTIFGDSLESFWQSPSTDLGYPNKIKIVKEVLIKTLADCVVGIKTDKEEKKYLVKAKNTTQRIKTNVTGEFVQISFESNCVNEILISKPQIVIGVI